MPDMPETPATPDLPDTPEPAVEKTSSSRRVVVGGAALATFAIIAGGGAFAFSQLSGGGAQPHDVLPSTVQAYARLDLDPSASQKIALFKLLRKLPDAAKELGDPETSDLRKLVIEEFVADTCTNVDYEQDVEPWLGQRIGIGADLEAQTLLVAAQVTDEKSARAGIDTLAECGGEDIGLAFLDGYAIISDSQKTVDDSLDATAKKSLGATTAFTAAMGELGEQGILSAWVDGDSIAKALPELGVPAEEIEQLGEIGTMAYALRVDGNAIELAGIGGMPESFTELDATPISELPADTVVAVSLSGLGSQVADQYDTFLDQMFRLEPPTVSPIESDPLSGVDPEILEQMDPETRARYDEYLDSSSPSSNPFASDPFAAGPEDLINSFESEFGLTIPDDLETLLGDTFTMAVGRANLENIPALSGPEDITSLDVAIHTQGDPTQTQEVMQTLADLAAEYIGVLLVAQQTDDGAVLATNDEAAQAVLDGGELGEQDTFRAVMPHGDDTVQGIYIDIAAIIDAIESAGPPDDVRDDLQQVEALAGIGMSVANVDDTGVFSLRVAFSD